MNKNLQELYEKIGYHRALSDIIRELTDCIRKDITMFDMIEIIRKLSTNLDNKNK